MQGGQGAKVTEREREVEWGKVDFEGGAQRDTAKVENQKGLCR